MKAKTIRIQHHRTMQEAIGNLPESAVKVDADRWKKYVAERNKLTINKPIAGAEKKGCVIL